MIWKKNIGPTIFDITDYNNQQTLCLLTLGFVMSVMTFRTKIFTAFEILIRGSFLLMVKYHVKNTCTNFKQNLLRREYLHVRKSVISKICSLNVMSVMWNYRYSPFLHKSLQLLLEIKIK